VQRVFGKHFEHVLIAPRGHEPVDDGVQPLLAGGVIRDDDLVAHAEQAEQDRRDHTGAILPRRAVVDRRSVGLGERRDHLRDALLRDLRHQDVSIGEAHRLGVVGSLGQHSIEERQMVKTQRRGGEQAAPFGAELSAGAQVHDVADAELTAETLQVSLRQVVQSIAPEELTPAHLATVGGGVAPQVAEVEAALKIDAAFHGV
jgi:hypothetical protein